MPANASEASAVAVEGVSKAFRLPQERVHTLKERALHPMRRTRMERLDALREVSFDVREGEFFGIVGRNGSGKSTLLKCIAGIYRADSGRMMLRGRVAPFIELGVGFNPNLPAYDNVLINAIMLGLTPQDARSRYEQVLEFAELEEFADLKLKNYSSGMYVRLAFAVMVEVNADVLLIDEVLAVGDAAFQQKCFDTLEARRRAGKTILFVTHDMNTVERICDRAMLLERGAIAELGAPGEVARRYNQLNFAGDGAASGEGASHGDGGAAILDAWFEDQDGRRIPALEQGQPCSFHALVELREDSEDPVFGFNLADEQHRRVFVASTGRRDQQTGRFTKGDRVQLRVAFDNVFAPGRYFASPLVARRGAGQDLMAARDDLVSFVVVGGAAGGGTVDIPHEITVESVERVAL